MISYIADITPEQRHELLTLLTQEPQPVLSDDQVLADLADTLRTQLNLTPSTDLAEGFRRRMIKTTEDLRGAQPPGYYDFKSDRAIASELVAEVSVQAQTLAGSEADDEFLAEFAKTFRTMPQSRRARFLSEAALAAGTAAGGKADPDRAAVATRAKSSSMDTAVQLAHDVAVTSAAARAAMKASGAAAAGSRAAVSGIRAAGGLSSLATAAAPIGLLAGGTVAYAIRKRRQKERAQHASAASRAAEVSDVQVRRDRQATQAVVTTCAYLLAVL
jgi:hypothetical protein